MIAIEKEKNKQIKCDCLNLNYCQFNTPYFIYHNQYPSVVKSQNLYPNHFLNLSSQSGKLDPSCLKIEVNQLSEVIQLDQNGMIYVAQTSKRTNCRSL
ncbi:hypothetical protein A4G19_04930 [Pasteurellaceae bacterium Macca]|nr:hypothetical protein [Pasteurellaceae bacterium Macca]